MKKKFLLLILCCVIFLLTACSSGSQKDSGSKSEEVPLAENEQTSTLTQEQALEAIKNYCFTNNPDLKNEVDSDEYTIYWDVTTNESNEIVVLYRSYTGSETRYYIDPISGEAYVTELVPGIIDDEQRTDESLNVRDYLK